MAPGRKVAFQMLCFLFFYLYFSWWYFSRSTFGPQDITFALTICLCFLDNYIHVQLILTMQMYLRLDEWLMTLKKFGNIGHSNKTVCRKSYMAKQMQKLVEIHTYIHIYVCVCVFVPSHKCSQKMNLPHTYIVLWSDFHSVTFIYEKYPILLFNRCLKILFTGYRI